MRPHQDSTLIPSWLITILVFILFSSMATQTTATPYGLLIEDPGVWTITGTFDSATDTWTNPNDVVNWSFSASVFSPSSFSVGPISDALGDFLNAFSGSASTGINTLRVEGLNGDRIDYLTIASTTYITAIEIEDLLATFEGETAAIINKAAVVPEPSTALLLLTGLAGIAGFRWQQSRRYTQ